jgi:hypothetical protein
MDTIFFYSAAPTVFLKDQNTFNHKFCVDGIVILMLRVFYFFRSVIISFRSGPCRKLLTYVHVFCFLVFCSSTLVEHESDDDIPVATEQSLDSFQTLYLL